MEMNTKSTLLLQFSIYYEASICPRRFFLLAVCSWEDILGAYDILQCREPFVPLLAALQYGKQSRQVFHLNATATNTKKHEANIPSKHSL